MTQELLVAIARNIKDNKQNLANAKFLIDAMREVGEDTREQELMLKELERKQQKWESMLKNRGISIG